MHQILYSSRQAIPDAVLRNMFVARKRVFVDLLKWDVPVLDDRFEIDQFDTASAEYLVLTDGDGAHLGSARLLPTSEPHILGDLFAKLCTEAPPRGNGIFEITRFCLDRTLRARDRRIVRDTLVTAIVMHALDHGISKYTAIAEMSWYQQILAFGWRCAPLGMPRACDNTLIAALAIEIDAATLSLLASRDIRPDPSILPREMSVAA